MQPYFFPYIGYFQLIAAADLFVLHDDVQWIKGGWINRNYILKDGRRHRLTFPVCRHSSLRPINEFSFVDESAVRNRLLRSISHSYRTAPYFNEVFPLLQRLLGAPGGRVVDFIRRSLLEILDYLKVPKDVHVASDLVFDKQLSGQDRVMAICRSVGARSYVNPIGGAQLYSASKFTAAGIHLCFLKPRIKPYPQQSSEFIPALSIIDALMFVDRSAVVDMMRDGEIV